MGFLVKCWGLSLKKRLISPPEEVYCNMRQRVDLKAILVNPTLRRELFIGVIIATQAREGIVTSHKQASSAYDSVQIARKG